MQALAPSTGERRLKAYAIGRRRRLFYSCDIAERGHKVVEGERQVALAAGPYAPWPSYDERYTYAPFVGAALQSPELAVVVEERGVGTALFVRAVVAGEDEHRVVCQSALVEQLHYLAHVSVEPRDHGCELCVRLWCGVVARRVVPAECAFGQETSAESLQQRIVGLPEFGMRQRVGENPEERLARPLLSQPRHGPLVYEVGAVLSSAVVVRAEHCVLNVLLQHFAHHGRVAARAAVAVEKIGKVQMCLKLAYVAVELVDAATVGRRDAAFIAAGPFPEEGGAVACALEQFGKNRHCRVIRLLTYHGEVGVLPVGHLPAPVLLVAPDVRVARMLSRHKARSRRR